MPATGVGPGCFSSCGAGWASTRPSARSPQAASSTRKAMERVLFALVAPRALAPSSKLEAVPQPCSQPSADQMQLGLRHLALQPQHESMVVCHTFTRLEFLDNRDGVCWRSHPAPQIERDCSEQKFETASLAAIAYEIFEIKQFPERHPKQRE